MKEHESSLLEIGEKFYLRGGEEYKTKGEFEIAKNRLLTLEEI